MKAFTTFFCYQLFEKSSILNVAEFLDLSLRDSPCTENSPVLCENQSFFLLFRNVVAFIKSLYYLLPYDKVRLCSLLLPLSCFYGSSYSKSKLLVKEQVFLKSNKVLDVYVFCNFCYPSFLL